MSALELAQAYRRFGSRVTVIEAGPQLMGREDADVANEMQRILSDEGIQILVAAEALNVDGRSGEDVSVTVRTPSGEQEIEGSDVLVAAGRIPNTDGIGLEEVGVELDTRGYIPSMNGWRPLRPTSGPWGTAPAARNSRTSPATTFESSGTTWPEESAARAIGSCPTACSPTRHSRMWD
jgi:hypothetical protein